MINKPDMYIHRIWKNQFIRNFLFSSHDCVCVCFIFKKKSFVSLRLKHKSKSMQRMNEWMNLSKWVKLVCKWMDMVIWWIQNKNCRPSTEKNEKYEKTTYWNDTFWSSFHHSVDRIRLIFFIFIYKIKIVIQKKVFLDRPIIMVNSCKKNGRSSKRIDYVQTKKKWKKIPFTFDHLWTKCLTFFFSTLSRLLNNTTL